MKNIKISIFSSVLFLLICDFSRAQPNFQEVGMASYYAAKFHGKRTASGEKYNMNDLTAAHPRLPFNTYVKVTNLRNQKSVIVRINDRGPHIKKRVIDLSKAAAGKIGLIQSGVARVKIELVESDGEKKPEEEAIAQEPVKDTENSVKEAVQVKDSGEGNFYDTKNKNYTLTGYIIQMSAFDEKNSAVKEIKKLKKHHKNNFYYEVAQAKHETVYRVVTGAYSNKKEAKKDLSKFRKAGLEAFIRKI